MNPSTIFTHNGNYEVTLYSVNSTCGDTAFYTTTINVTGSSLITTVPENSIYNSQSNIDISKDKDGYYAKFNFYENTNAQISVWNILGEKVVEDIFVKNTKDDKIYINTGNAKNALIIISVNADNGDKGYMKILSE